MTLSSELFKLAFTYERENKYDLAEVHYLQAIEQKNYKASNNLALLYKKLNNRKKSGAVF